MQNIRSLCVHCAPPARVEGAISECRERSSGRICSAGSPRLWRRRIGLRACSPDAALPPRSDPALPPFPSHLRDAEVAPSAA